MTKNYRELAHELAVYIAKADSDYVADMAKAIGSGCLIDDLTDEELKGACKVMAWISGIGSDNV